MELDLEIFAESGLIRQREQLQFIPRIDIETALEQIRNSVKDRNIRAIRVQLFSTDERTTEKGYLL